MSDSGQRPREWRFYVQDMIKFGEKSCPIRMAWTRTRSSLTALPTMLLCTIWRCLAKQPRTYPTPFVSSTRRSSGERWLVCVTVSFMHIWALTTTLSGTLSKRLFRQYCRR